jgi:Bacterial transcriptional activator domain
VGRRPARHREVGRVQRGLAAAPGAVAGRGRAAAGHGALGYRLEVRPGQLDLHGFERLTEQARQALAAGRLEEAAEGFRETLALWQGLAIIRLPRRWIQA